MIHLSHVFKTFDNGHSFAVQDLSFTLEKGETLAILGSSGAGKSTVLKMINRLVDLSSGKIEVNGQDVQNCDPVQLRRAMGYVFQGIGLFPHITVQENIEIVLRLTKQPVQKRRQRSYELLDLMGLNPALFAARYPAQLSGGQQQRVGVARALAADPEYLLMDEPFGALDAITRDDLQKEVMRLKKELNKTILFVTHDIFEAMRIGNRLAIMHKGRLEQIGTKYEITHAPATVFVQELLQKTAERVRDVAEYF